MKLNNTDKNKNKSNKNRKPLTDGGGGGFNPMWIYAIVGMTLLGFWLFSSNAAADTKQLDRNTFFEYLKDGYVKNVRLTLEDNRVDVFLTENALKLDQFKDANKKDNSLAAFAQAVPQFSFIVADNANFEKDVEQSIKDNSLTTKYTNIPPDKFGNFFWSIMIWVLIFGALWFFMFRRIGGAGGGPGGQIFNIGKSRAKLFDENDKVKVSFKDVAGLEGAKEEVEEIVEFLKNPEKFTKLGGKIPKGALLVGPPGTGKTLLAKAVAGEAEVPFFSLSGSDFVEMFVGVGASRVRDLFKNAKDKSPAIIFIDEIDAIGRARGKGNFTGGNDERENTLNQLLTEMDGFGTNTNVIVLAATNRADILDKALMRAGRFDRLIHVDLPEMSERKQIFEVHLKPLKHLGTDVDVDFLAKQTPGFSGADIANICNEAALVAARKNKDKVERQDFLDAVDRIIGGLEKKGKLIKPKEKERIAYHEAGHATVGWLLPHAAPLVKVTIVPRGKSLGAAWYLPEERQITTTEQMLDELAATMGGRAAEKVVFGDISTGALSDLERVTKQATAMVSVYGLNEKIGNISYYDSSGQTDYSFNKPYSDETAKIIDEEISKIIETQYQRAQDILTENREKLDRLAKKLLEKEVIFRDDLVEIFGERTSEEDSAIDPPGNVVSQTAAT